MSKINGFSYGRGMLLFRSISIIKFKWNQPILWMKLALALQNIKKMSSQKNCHATLGVDTRSD